MRFPRVAATSAVIAVFTVGWIIGMARAAPATAGSLVLLDEDGTVATAINIDRLYPGATAWKRFVVGLSTEAMPATTGFMIQDLEDFERDCNDPETTSGDATCGDGPNQGEMSQQLLVSVVLGSVGTSRTCPPDLVDPEVVFGPVTLAAAALTGPQDLGMATLGPGQTRCAEVRFNLPWEADNLVQTDAASFDLVFGAQQALSSATADRTDVLGSEAATADRVSGRDVTTPLSHTGTSVNRVLLAGFALVTAGVTLLRGSRRFQSRAARPSGR